TNRGWKHVTGSEQGHHRRPFLTTNNKLLGTGRFAAPPEGGPEYRRGYLCGMVRGDGLHGTRSYLSASGRTAWNTHQSRLALVDLEALRRARAYLAEFNVATIEHTFQTAGGATEHGDALRNFTRLGVGAIHELVA